MEAQRSRHTVPQDQINALLVKEARAGHLVIRLTCGDPVIFGRGGEEIEELAEHGITANAVCPGPVDTPMTQALHTAQFRQEYAKAIPMERYGTPQEIAAAVLYLASEEATYTTGIALPVDGGFLASGARGL